jgi:hypothetical protein
MKTISKKYLGLFMLIALVLFNACEKEEEVIVTPVSISYTSLDTYWETKAPTAESFIFTAQNGTTFTTKNGSVVTIPSNALITSSGLPVSGSVSVKMKEIFTKSEMMYSGILPVSYGNVLNSGGEFFIQATQNGNALRVADNMLVEVEIPAQAIANNMQLFFAEPIEEPDTMNWVQVDQGWFPQDSLGSSFGFNAVDSTYEIDLDTLTWCNIDGFMSGVSYFDCTFNLTGITGLDGSNTKAVAFFKNQNSAWNVGVSAWGSIVNDVISETHLADVPLNLVVISVVDGDLYSGVLDITPQSNQVYSISMSITTSDDLDQLILSLP